MASSREGSGQRLAGWRERRPGWPSPRARAARRSADVIGAPASRPPRGVAVSSAARYPGHRRPAVQFGAGLALAVALLILLGYVVGHGPDLGLGAFVESVLEAATGEVTAPVFAFMLIAIGTWCIHRLWLEWLTWRPGQVVIPVFTEGSELTDANPLHLTALFRQRFSSLRVESRAPVPGGEAGADFLEVLGQKSLSVKDPLSSLMALVQAAKPTHAYVIHGVLVERHEQPKYGVTIQVVRRPDEGAPPETVWDISFERAVRRAADRAMAYILPRTRKCEAQWASWRGFVMPSALLETYEAAGAFEQQRRYDQALARYFEAVERDPMNLSLRLCIGHLQEKLGLYIDALATYEGMIAVHESTDCRAKVRLYRPAAQRERDRVMLLCRYRRLVLLGGPPLAQQWRHTSTAAEWTERDTQRKDVRRRLNGRLAERLGETVEKHPLSAAVTPAPGALEALLDESFCVDQDDPRINELRQLFVLHALDELDPLKRDLAGFRAAARDGDLALTEKSVELTRICMRERLRWIEQQLTEPKRWIWSADGVARLTGDIEAVCGHEGMPRWHEHYNAACAFALPLLVEDDGPATARDRLAIAAVGHLQQATACADSGYIATRRHWLLSEDPDLDGLRVHPAFKAFEAMYFPAPAPTPRRPRHVQRLEVSRYTRDLLVAVATRWLHEWHSRRRSDALENPHALIEWWVDEAQAWQLVGRAAWNHRRWRARYDLLERMDELSVKYGGQPLEVSFKSFNEPWLCAQSEQKVEELATQALDGATCQLRALAESLSDDAPTAGEFGIDGLDTWMDKLRDKDADGLPARPEDVVRLCDRHAALWDSLVLWVSETRPVQRDAAAKRFAAQRRKLTAQLLAGA